MSEPALARHIPAYVGLADLLDSRERQRGRFGHFWQGTGISRLPGRRFSAGPDCRRSRTGWLRHPHRLEASAHLQEGQHFYRLAPDRVRARVRARRAPTFCRAVNLA